MNNKTNDEKAKRFFEQNEVIYTYTSEQAAEDGILFDLDQLVPAKFSSNFFLKYITAGLLSKGYWNNCCKHGVKNGEQGKTPRCQTCTVYLNVEKSLNCLNPSLNFPNILDFIFQATQIFKRKPKNDYFISGKIELPNGEHQKIFISQNETGRYSAMLPEEY
ncbi:MAG: hypothetical protein IAX21_00860 [Candidatus Bathyarchaeota archaeon]|nr:hypothetical protein [Candidatus Bathyarchaeum tardum]WGM90480.1 MAG: hypothetical protein NUK63_04985 [Candidatus Bathyarchaeum tardum]WNZ29452.1 MAG: hypothetical protein IAX21_00860 [Candidatus Bathyarchaeota archaeon]